jgi:hypothetical protein
MRKNIMKIFFFLLIPSVIFYILAFFIKSYRIDLSQSGIEISCKFNCIESSVISLSQIPIALILIVWSRPIKEWVDKKFPGYNRSIIPSIWFMRCFGLFLLVMVAIGFLADCGCF